ncbi:E3 ubiquitin-protein ligase RNF34-like isoform X1 [Limulus polyphemus]|uniref:E3 ubiquitin-protein ligase RNF34-like isoform X1 n=1 Tax=Limulus polyphemus TaxID=6850 RepID=A0ABM1C4V1_LIMPO|nr:E3 ubiquitin-protein ligase RNF34-like isoform X1 [Limulus polyphemus]
MCDSFFGSKQKKPRHPSSNQKYCESIRNGCFFPGPFTFGSREVQNTTCCNCSVQFSLLKRKRTCSFCNYNFCSACLSKDQSVRKQPKCFRCSVLFAVPLDRAALMRLRVRDLQWFLKHKSISTIGCKEKNELVELIFQDSNPPASCDRTSTYTNIGSQNHTIFSNLTSSGSSSSAEVHTTPQDETSEETHTYQSVVREQPQLSHTSASGVSNDSEEVNEEEQVNLEHSQGDKKEKTEFDQGLYIAVDDIHTPNQIDNLSARQLKLILTRNFIGYHGIYEKKDLQAKVHWLWAQKQKVKDLEGVPDEDLCKICMEQPIDSVLLECGHMATCTVCGKQLNECPLCRQYVVRVVHVFRA